MTAPEPPKTMLGQTRVGWSSGRWRARWGRAALAGLPLLAALEGIPHRRLPFPGEMFYPADLTAHWWTALFVAGLFGTVIALIAWSILRRRPAPAARSQATVEIDSRELRIGHALKPTERVDRADIEHAYADEPHGRAVVHLSGGEVISIECPGREREVAAALAPARAARVPIGSLAASKWPAAALLWSLFLATLLVLTVSLGAGVEQLFSASLDPLDNFVSAAVSLGVMAAAWPLLRRRTALVGTDGVRIDGLWRKRFVPLDAIRGLLARDDGGVRIHRADGASIDIPGACGNQGLQKRIAQAMAQRNAARTGAAPPVDALARGGRTALEWQRDLKKLASDASYRHPSLRIAELEALLEDPTTTPEQRVGAAVALSSQSTARERIRIAAEASADPDLRAALEAAAEGEVELAALERATRRQAG